MAYQNITADNLLMLDDPLPKKNSLSTAIASDVPHKFRSVSTNVQAKNLMLMNQKGKNGPSTLNRSRVDPNGLKKSQFSQVQPRNKSHNFNTLHHQSNKATNGHETSGDLKVSQKASSLPFHARSTAIVDKYSFD